MNSAANSLAPDAAVRRRDWQIILLMIHASSHFFQLVLPSLYVSLGNAFGLDFARLGLLVSTFYVVSGIGQASSGFVVDRIGARPVLWFGLSCFVVSGLLIGSANGYAMLMAAAVVGGIGNSVFHPADYSIINHRVTAPRLGHAFGARPDRQSGLGADAGVHDQHHAAGRLARGGLTAPPGWWRWCCCWPCWGDLIGGPAAAEADAAKTGARPPAAQQGVLATLATLLSAGAVGRLPVLRFHLDRAVLGAELHHSLAGPAL